MNCLLFFYVKTILLYELFPKQKDKKKELEINANNKKLYIPIYHETARPPQIRRISDSPSHQGEGEGGFLRVLCVSQLIEQDK